MAKNEIDSLVGRVIHDRFKIVAVVARGGMGKVYRAEQAPLGRACAIKVLNPNYAGEHDPEFHKRFFLEASIASKLTHPNTVTIFDYGRTDDDIYYIAMEMLEGQTLQHAIRATRGLPEERATHIARQICRALREAHSLGVIHRDLKPANIFLVEHGDETDFVKVLDFGLVKNVADKGEDLTQTGLFMGSPKYMAPEQIRGDRVDARTDIYALGVILYEMLTGSVPFDRANSVNTLMAHVNEDPQPLASMNPNISVSPELEHTVMRCLAKEADARFRSMDEVLAALKRSGAGTLTATISGTSGESPSAMSSSGGHAAARISVPAPSGPFVSGAGSDAGRVASPFLPFTESGAPVVTPPRKPAGRGVLATSIFAAAATVAAVAWFATRSASPPQPATASAPAPVASVESPVASETPAPPAPGPTAALSTTATPATAAAATPPRIVKLRLRTEPEGVTVKDDGVEICSNTPCDHLYQGEDADPAREHKLTFTKSGYKDEVRAVRLDEPNVKVTMKRVFIPPAATTRATLPDGFRDFPPSAPGKW